jgi:DNA-binding CsgD family transcriptional regulator
LGGTYIESVHTSRQVAMIENVRLSRREIEVMELLLDGKSNKQIARSLDISIRTVEFHLKNIYAKFKVTSRVELILKLGNATGKFEIEKLGYSTVDKLRKKGENRKKLNSHWNWATSFRDTISVIGKELEMKNLLNSKHLYVGIITALTTGFTWLVVLSSQLLPGQIKTFIVPLIVIWTIIGLSVGLMGKRNGSTLIKIGFSSLIGTGLSPFTIIPLMLVLVLPIGKFAERLGLIDAATMPSDVAITLSTIIMITMWFVVGVTIGITLLFVTIRKPEEKDFHEQTSEHTL